MSGDWIGCTQGLRELADVVARLSLKGCGGCRRVLMTGKRQISILQLGWDNPRHLCEINLIFPPKMLLIFLLTDEMGPVFLLLTV